MDRKRKNTVSFDTDLKFLNYIKRILIYSVGNNDIFYMKLPVLVRIIEETINNTDYTKSCLITNVYKELALVVGKDFSKNKRSNDPYKIRHCITIITYEIYIKIFPEKLNINKDTMYESYPYFNEYTENEKSKLFDYYKCVVILKNIIGFQRNFGFICDLATMIVEGSSKKYPRGGRANIQTQNRSKIVFDVYGEVKKPSMRHIGSIFNNLGFIDFENLNKLNNDNTSSYDDEDDDSNQSSDESFDDKSIDDESIDDESNDENLSNYDDSNEHTWKRMKLNLGIFE